MENDQKWPDASPWHPPRDQKTLKILGKLIEEMGEMIAALGRCICQGIEERHPVTGKPNRHWLLEEEADVLVGMRLLRQHIKMTDQEYDASAERMTRKRAHLDQWHAYADSPPTAWAYECEVKPGIWLPGCTLTTPPEGPTVRNVRALRE